MTTHAAEVEKVALPAAPRSRPRRAPLAVPTAIVLALVLIGLAVVAVRDLVVGQGWAAGTPVVSTSIDGLGGVRASVGLAVAGGVLAIVGVVLLWFALRPGRRTHLRVTGAPDLWLSPGAVAAIAQETADRLPGVVSAESSLRARRRVVVDIVATAPPAGSEDPQERAAVSERVRAVLDDEIGRLTGASIKVRATEVPR
ncbi:hypothetical protein FB381_1796 [Nocardioides albertanoniae]|uniref:DUF6286 domain-containing protein n=1 Tax=Nocardioides albertanoniae TaxID=1175486 RepID=A0A543A5S6_9ACTN|nr:DUF6286 domain-containing protein [Nocardioides albertanoniae]TQL67908.1 hypothetical protein FB381_1796 [Nocardioides albertanoniae]